MELFPHFWTYDQKNSLRTWCSYDLGNRKWNFLNRKWNYFTHFCCLDQKTSLGTWSHDSKTSFKSRKLNCLNRCSVFMQCIFVCFVFVCLFACLFEHLRLQNPNRPGGSLKSIVRFSYGDGEVYSFILYHPIIHPIFLIVTYTKYYFFCQF